MLFMFQTEIHTFMKRREHLGNKGIGAEWPFNFLPEIEFWALTHIKFQSNSNIAK